MPSTFDFGVYDTDLYGSLPVTRVRELPPLRQHLEAVTPSGRHYRWGEDEPDPANVPSGQRSSSTMPGGWESLDVVLPRKPGVDYTDLESLTTVNVWGAGGNKCGEYRLERAPSTSGDQMSVSPGAVGWQAHLGDNKSASDVIIDRDITRWRSPSGSRQKTLFDTGFNPLSGQVEVRSDPLTPAPALVLSHARVNQPGAANIAIAETLYDAGPGNLLGSISCNFETYDKAGGGLNTLAGSWFNEIAVVPTDSLVGGDFSGDLGTNGTVTVNAAGARRYGMAHLYLGGAQAEVDGVWEFILKDLHTIGDHGLTLRGTSIADEGFFASDIVGHVVSRWAPLLTWSASTVIPSAFVIDHLVFYDSTTAGEMIRQATRVGLQTWAVWNDKTLWWHERGVFGRKWRARIAPAQLEETGPQVDRLWNSVIVQYQDVSGITMTAGPVGSGADTEDASLTDSDPDNPATVLGIERREHLVMGTGTPSIAVEVGRRFLEESKLLDKSGRARLVGHVMDDRGVLHPYFDVRAGDTISFVDASDTSERYIVRAQHDRDTRTCSVDLDAPPEGLTALLERLDVALAYPPSSPGRRVL